MILPKKPKTCPSASKMLTKYFKKDIFCTYNTNSLKVVYPASPDKLRILMAIHCLGVGYVEEHEWDNLIETIQHNGWEMNGSECKEDCWTCGNKDYQYQYYWSEPQCRCCGKKYYWKTLQ